LALKQKRIEQTAQFATIRTKLVEWRYLYWPRQDLALFYKLPAIYGLWIHPTAGL